MTPIGGTCVCCDSRFLLMDALATAELAENSVMLLEANGSADAPQLIEMLTADTQASRYTLPVQVVVVDVKRWQKRAFRNVIEHSQVPTASYILLTRTEEVGPERLQHVRAELSELAPRAIEAQPPALATMTHALLKATPRLRPRRFMPVFPQIESHDAAGGGHHHHAQHHFSSCEIRLPPRVDVDALSAFLKALPREVIRAKGIAYRDDEAGTPVYFQTVEGPSEPSIHDIDPRERYDPVLILIGVNLDASHFEPAVADLGAKAEV